MAKAKRLTRREIINELNDRHLAMVHLGCDCAELITKNKALEEDLLHTKGILRDREDQFVYTMKELHSAENDRNYWHEKALKLEKEINNLKNADFFILKIAEMIENYYNEELKGE